MEYQTESEFKELLALYKALPKRQRVLEIGSMMGDTLREWMKHGDPGMTLVSVDKVVPPGDSRHAAQTQAHADWQQLAVSEAAKLVVIDDYSQADSTIARVKTALGGGGLDFLFIDGGHDYETVKADFHNYAPLVRPGGLVAFHDIQGIADVARFWSELEGAVRSDTGNREPNQTFSICHPNGWGIGVLRKRDDRPPLHIITPCSRPDNLSQIANSLEVASDFFRVTWWIIADGSKIKKPANSQPPGLNMDIRIFICRATENVAGKAQINVALDKIEDGWVWVLDDDNVAHPDFFRRLYEIQNPRCAAVAFAQLNRQGGIRAVGPDAVKECSIDQAQFVLRRELIGGERYLQKYTADGEFAERIYKLGGLVWEFCNEPLTYYNWIAK